jgi:hypothetical protein
MRDMDQGHAEPESDSNIPTPGKKGRKKAAPPAISKIVAREFGSFFRKRFDRDPSDSFIAKSNSIALTLCRIDVKAKLVSEMPINLTAAEDLVHTLRLLLSRDVHKERLTSDDNKEKLWEGRSVNRISAEEFWEFCSARGPLKSDGSGREWLLHLKTKSSANPIGRLSKDKKTKDQVEDLIPGFLKHAAACSESLLSQQHHLLPHLQDVEADSVLTQKANTAVRRDLKRMSRLLLKKKRGITQIH